MSLDSTSHRIVGCQWRTCAYGRHWATSRCYARVTARDMLGTKHRRRPRVGRGYGNRGTLPSDRVRVYRSNWPRIMGHVPGTSGTNVQNGHHAGLNLCVPPSPLDYFDTSVAEYVTALEFIVRCVVSHGRSDPVEDFTKLNVD